MPRPWECEKMTYIKRTIKTAIIALGLMSLSFSSFADSSRIIKSQIRIKKLKELQVQLTKKMEKTLSFDTDGTSKDLFLSYISNFMTAHQAQKKLEGKKIAALSMDKTEFKHEEMIKAEKIKAFKSIESKSINGMKALGSGFQVLTVLEWIKNDVNQEEFYLRTLSHGYSRDGSRARAHYKFKKIRYHLSELMMKLGTSEDFETMISFYNETKLIEESETTAFILAANKYYEMNFESSAPRTALIKQENAQNLN